MKSVSFEWNLFFTVCEQKWWYVCSARNHSLDNASPKELQFIYFFKVILCENSTQTQQEYCYFNRGAKKLWSKCNAMIKNMSQMCKISTN